MRGTLADSATTTGWITATLYRNSLEVWNGVQQQQHRSSMRSREAAIGR